jgi:hypothetical protein
MMNLLIRVGPLGKTSQFVLFDVIVNGHVITRFGVGSKIRLQNGVNAQPFELFAGNFSVKPAFCALCVPA